MGNCLRMAGIELRVLSRQSMDKRSECETNLRIEIEAYEDR